MSLTTFFKLYEIYTLLHRCNLKILAFQLQRQVWFQLQHCSFESRGRFRGYYNNIDSTLISTWFHSEPRIRDCNFTTGESLWWIPAPIGKELGVGWGGIQKRFRKRTPKGRGMSETIQASLKTIKQSLGEDRQSWWRPLADPARMQYQCKYISSCYRELSRLKIEN